MAEEENMKDALRDNIDRKGKYSYYYGHANQDAIMRESGSAIKTMGGRPKLLHRTTVTRYEAPKRRTIPSYAWTDMKKSVRIYIEDDILKGVETEKVKSKWEEQSVRISFVSGGFEYVLDIPKLSREIEGVSFKRKNETNLTVVLKKATEGTWYELKASTD